MLTVVNGLRVRAGVEEGVELPDTLAEGVTDCEVIALACALADTDTMLVRETLESWDGLTL